MDIVKWKNLDPVTIPLKGTTEQKVVYTTTDSTHATRDNSFIADAKLAVHGSTGAQLANLPNKSNVNINGVMWTAKDNVITANGVAKNSPSNTTGKISYDIPITPGNYHLSGGTQNVNAVVRITDKNGSNAYYVNNRNFTIVGDEKSALLYLQVPANGIANNETISVMLNKGNIALPFEPYTGGTPYTDKYTATIKSQTENNVMLSIENVSELAGDSTVLDVVLTDKNDITKRSEDGKTFTGGEQV